jgi:hypothetical protein
MGGSLYEGSPVGYTLLGALVVDFAVQWVCWAAAAAWQTEKFYDLVGSGTFLGVAVGTLCVNDEYHPRAILATCMVGVWAVRLGGYLVKRVLHEGKDTRFDGVRENPKRFFVFWTVQGVWVWVTLLPVLLINGARGQRALGWYDAVGAGVWALGFAIEAVADAQKARWRARPENKGRFITVGLWGISRHPNYCAPPGGSSLMRGPYMLPFHSPSGPHSWRDFVLDRHVWALGVLVYVAGELRARRRVGGQPCVCDAAAAQNLGRPAARETRPQALGRAAGLRGLPAPHARGCAVARVRPGSGSRGGGRIR